MARCSRLAGCWVFLLWSIFFGRSFFCDGVAARGQATSSYSRRFLSSKIEYQRIAAFRGGETAEEDEEDEDEIEEEERDDNDGELEKSFSVTNTLLDISKRALMLVGKATIMTTRAVTRAVKAGLSSEAVEEEEEEVTMVKRIIRTMQRMWGAALRVPEGKEGLPPTSFEGSAEKKKEKSRSLEQSSNEEESERLPDFGAYLAKSYHVSVDRDASTPVLGGTIGDALREARSKARLLVAFIPASRPGPSKKIRADQVAIRSLLSRDVAHAANKRARKKEEYGSFVLWGAKASSPEAITAIKRLKAKQPGSKADKRPFLLVAYPAQVFDSSGVPKLVPKLLAQHHCSPPPSVESMAAYLNALRKRHVKQYASMQHDLREAKLYKERTEGYKSSVESDRQRREREKREEEERLAKERTEAERLAALERRREELRESLPVEPGTGVSDAMTIALRFADGRAGQRRFTPDTPIQTLFNWVDAFFGMEREKVVLTTMNGQRSFSWAEDDSTTLGSSGLGRMTGLRVTEKKPVDEESAGGSNIPQTAQS